ncbi:tyrosine-type recombinase/integrase [Cryptosporangium sp. NPDC048952]|uniref:tyrosine-type recombinase/integrase n=1 Tax=Cryptosporangium sp. NPDC048952 TaxID=3363961 RepID=UPI0037197C4C
MISQDAVFKACSCEGHRRNRQCPHLSEYGHGSWQFDCRVLDVTGDRKQIRRGGFTSEKKARAALARFRAQSPHPDAAAWTVETWVRHWLTTRTSIRQSTLASYTQHCDDYLIPALGRIPLHRLTITDIATAHAGFRKRRNRYGRPLSAATIQRIHATLRGALKSAVRQGLLTDNPARHVELPPADRPHPVLWTPARVETWHRDGVRDTVMVWTADQLACFLRSVRADRLYPLWHLYALRGLRRGEGIGLRWCDVDLDTGQIHITQQRTESGGKIITGPPKSKASRRADALDHSTIRMLRAHRSHRHTERVTVGAAWAETGYVFTRSGGQPLAPTYVTHRFADLVADSGLPPVRLHDLRHGAATLAHAAGADLKTIQDQLGHASIAMTADTYTTVLPDAQFAAADATADLVLGTRTRARGNAVQRARQLGCRPDIRSNTEATRRASRGARRRR